MSGLGETQCGPNLPTFSRGQKVGGGRFMLMRPLGRGPAGMVWLAEDEDLKRSVAVKFLPRAIGGDDFWAEIARAQKLVHPHIVRIHALCEENPTLAFIAMEHVDGLTLSALRLQEENRFLKWSFLEPLVMQLCEALEHAHGEKIFHGNLKPSNLMVTHDGKLKVTDFGMPGSPPYISPQQLDSGKAQMTDDVYALGAVLYEMLTSKPLFYTGDIAEQMRQTTPTLIAERIENFKLANSVPTHVRAAIESCVAKDAVERPQSAGAVAKLLREEPPEIFRKEDEASARGEKTKEGNSFGRWFRWLKG